MRPLAREEPQDGLSFSRIAKSAMRVPGLPRSFSFKQCARTSSLDHLGIRPAGHIRSDGRIDVLKSAPDVLSLKPGTLDDTSWLWPSSFIWMKSAQGWVPVPNGVKALEGQT
jgi:hypothetical protein